MASCTAAAVTPRVRFGIALVVTAVLALATSQPPGAQVQAFGMVHDEVRAHRRAAVQYSAIRAGVAFR